MTPTLVIAFVWDAILQIASRFIGVFLSMSLSVAHGSGGRIEGKVSDPKGASIVGAAITVIDPINDQKFTNYDGTPSPDWITRWPVSTPAETAHS